MIVMMMPWLIFVNDLLLSPLRRKWAETLTETPPWSICICSGKSGQQPRWEPLCFGLECIIYPFSPPPRKFVWFLAIKKIHRVQPSSSLSPNCLRLLHSHSTFFCDFVDCCTHSLPNCLRLLHSLSQLPSTAALTLNFLLMWLLSFHSDATGRASKGPKKKGDSFAVTNYWCCKNWCCACIIQRLCFACVNVMFECLLNEFKWKHIRHFCAHVFLLFFLSLCKFSNV